MFKLLRTHPRPPRSIRRSHPGRGEFEPDAVTAAAAAAAAADYEWQLPPVNVNLPCDHRCIRRELCEVFDPESDEYRPAFHKESKCHHSYRNVPEGRKLQKDVTSAGQIIWDDIGEGAVAESLSWCQSDTERENQTWGRKPDKSGATCRNNASWCERKVNRFDDLNDAYLPERHGSVGYRDEKRTCLRNSREETGSLPNCNKYHGEHFADKRSFRKTGYESSGVLKKPPCPMDAAEILPAPLRDNLRFGGHGRSPENSIHSCSHSYSSFKQQDDGGGLYPSEIPRQEVNLFRRQSNATNGISPTSGGFYYLSSKHWLGIILIVLFGGAVGVALPYALRIQEGTTLNDRLALATSLLKQVPLIDGHNDLPWNIRKFLHNRLNEFKFREDLRQIKPWSSSAWSHTDLPRLKAGHVSAQFWSAYVPCESQFKDAVQLAFEQVDVIRRLTERFHPDLTLCTTSADIMEAHTKGQLCSLIGVEGGHSVGSSLPVLRALYEVGVRYLTLTSTCNTPWAECSQTDPTTNQKPKPAGLTNFGKSVVKEMNRLGMVVDLSHVSEATMIGALNISKAPVIFSHSSAHAVCNSTRNVPDRVLKLLAKNGGVIMLNFYSQLLSCRETATVQDAVAHLEHVRNVAGAEHIGLGAGYDGINSTPEGLDDASSYPVLFAELLAAGWSEDHLKRLAGLNFLRVLQKVEEVRDELKVAGASPSEDVIAPRLLAPHSNCTSKALF